MIDEVGRHRDAGVSVTQVAPPRTPTLAHFRDWMSWFAESVIPVFRD
jgi:hypothetical protein